MASSHRPAQGGACKFDCDSVRLCARCVTTKRAKWRARARLGPRVARRAPVTASSSSAIPSAAPKPRFGTAPAPELAEPSPAPVGRAASPTDVGAQVGRALVAGRDDCRVHRPGDVARGHARSSNCSRKRRPPRPARRRGSPRGAASRAVEPAASTRAGPGRPARQIADHHVEVVHAARRAPRPRARWAPATPAARAGQHPSGGSCTERARRPRAAHSAGREVLEHGPRHRQTGRDVERASGSASTTQTRPRPRGAGPGSRRGSPPRPACTPESRRVVIPTVSAVTRGIIGAPRPDSPTQSAAEL